MILWYDFERTAHSNLQIDTFGLVATHRDVVLVPHFPVEEFHHDIRLSCKKICKLASFGKKMFSIKNLKSNW